jgi:hypothetical protein
MDTVTCGDADESRSSSSYKTANEEALSEEPTHQPQTEEVSRTCSLLICYHKQLLSKLNDETSCFEGADIQLPDVASEV